MVKFKPIAGADYKYDYLDIFKTIAAGRIHAIQTYRELCLKDLFFVLYFGLQREDVNHKFVIDCIRDVEEDHENTLDLWAREHYKSTIITYGLPIQELVQNPEERICIFSHTRPIAKGFLRQIKFSLENPTPIRKWFPDIFYKKPKQQAPKWSEDDGLIIRRKTNPKEASIEGWGLVDGQPTSKHFTVRIYDDIVTRESCTTQEQIKKNINAYELSQSLGTDGGSKRLAGTHYHFADTYAHLKKKEGYKVRLKPATHDAMPTGKPVFLSQARLDELRREQGPYIFSCQQLLKPIAGEDQRFKPKWLKYYDEPPLYTNKYLLVDPANEKKKRSDYTVMAVIGIDTDSNRFLLDMLRDKLDLRERWEALRTMYLRYEDIQRVGYEKYGMMSDITYMEEKMEEEEEEVQFEIVPLGGQMGKWDRIYRLVPHFANGQFLLPNRLFYTTVNEEMIDVIKVFIDEEYSVAPFCLHEDMLDCLSRIEDEDLEATPYIGEMFAEGFGIGKTVSSQGDW